MPPNDTRPDEPIAADGDEIVDGVVPADQVPQDPGPYPLSPS